MSLNDSFKGEKMETNFDCPYGLKIPLNQKSSNFRIPYLDASSDLNVLVWKMIPYYFRGHQTFMKVDGAAIERQFQKLILLVSPPIQR